MRVTFPGILQHLSRRPAAKDQEAKRRKESSKFAAPTLQTVERRSREPYGIRLGSGGGPTVVTRIVHEAGTRLCRASGALTARSRSFDVWRRRQLGFNSHFDASKVEAH